MLEYTFSIQHQGCWTEKINKEFPELTASIVYSYRLRNRSITMIEANNIPESSLDDLLCWFNDHPIMISAKAVHYNDVNKSAYICLIGKYSDESEPVLDVLLGNQCFPIIPATVTRGREHWTVVGPTNEAVSQAHAELQQIGSVSVDSLGDPELDQVPTGLITIKQAIYTLSSRQREVLMRAIKEGYYDSPRSCSIESLAEADSANTSTVGKHLRKSEAKILQAALPLLIDSSSEFENYGADSISSSS